MTTILNGVYKVVHASGKSRSGEDAESRWEERSDEIASNIMREWGFAPVALPKWSPDLHANARPAEEETIFLRVATLDQRQLFSLFRKKGDVELILDEGKVLEVQKDEEPAITYLFKTRGRDLKMSLKCVLLETAESPCGNGKARTAFTRHPTPPLPPDTLPPQNLNPPPSPEDEDNTPPNSQPLPKPKRERKTAMPKGTTNFLLDLKSKLDGGTATDTEITAVIEKEMNAEGKKGDNTARIAKELERSVSWVELYYRLRNLTQRLKPLIDEMGMPVAKQIAIAPEFEQGNIWQKVQQEENPHKRGKLASQLVAQSRAGEEQQRQPQTPIRTRKATRHTRTAIESNGDVTAIEAFIQKLQATDMNGDIKSKVFDDFVRVKTAGELEAAFATLKGSQDTIGRISEGILTAYRQFAEPFLKKH